jgi:penicillin amidase
MEGMRRLAAGRLSEVLGARTVEIDRAMRTFGFAGLAEAQYASSSPEVRRILDAYAAGVNLWLQRHRGALPPEFLAVGHAPDHWRPVDSLLWLRTMSLRLAGNRSEELLRERLSRILSPEMLADLWPPALTGSLLVIPGGDGDGEEKEGPPAEGGPQNGGASNMWVLGGGRTESGKPLLASDPHLGLTAPIAWYLARVETPQGRLAGATAPGFPFFIFGHNDRIAWALTSTGSDVEDLVLERADPADPSRYVTEEGTLPFAVRSETIRVRGGEDVVVEIRASRHGPIVGELEPPTPGGETRLLALQASYLSEDDRAPEAALGVNAARGWDEFVAALSGQKVIQQNFGYADVDGNIGFIAPGRVPMRRPGEGRVPRPGWTGEPQPEEIAFDALPRAFNPPAGVIINANNRIVAPSYPFYLGDGWDAGFRAERIAQLIEASSAHTVESMAAMQVDTVSLVAKTLLPMMLDPLEGDDSRESARKALRAWAADPAMAADRPEPLIFAAWLRAFVEEVGRDKLGGLFESWWGFRPLFAERVLRQRPVWCDRLSTPEVEACAGRLRDALARAMADLSSEFGEDWRSWRWDAAHEARFSHQLLGRLPLAAGAVNVTTPIGGGNDTVLRAASDLTNADAPFAAVHGAGFRGIYDLADLSRSRFIIAPGQSGNPLSIHYRDLVGIWREGGSVTLAPTREALERDAFATLTLAPSATVGQR